ncbi:MAG: hypothetical protein K0B09_07310 [Bacteroidales bacterium]|nr:hypothetical protein [Bacteroidales bacterium]
MRQFITTAILFLTIICTYGQHPAVSQPGYNPTVPRLFSMQHKAISHTFKQIKPNIQDFDQKLSKEEINIYVVYEMDSTLGRNSMSDRELFNPPRKLMDIYLIYEYTFRIYCQSKDLINENIPEINLSTGGFVDDIRIVNYFVDRKGKLKEKRIRKSAISADLNNGVLSVMLDKDQLTDNSFTEINIQIKSRDFKKIIPSISNKSFFDKSLTLSYPAIFNYEIPTSNEFNLVSNSISTFELLHFRRDPGPGNGNIDKVIVDSKIYEWKLNQENQLNIEFDLWELNIPPLSDIGIGLTDIVKD